MDARIAVYHTMAVAGVLRWHIGPAHVDGQLSEEQ
jgi:hypothetical protein